MNENIKASETTETITYASTGVRRTHAGSIHQLWATESPVWNGRNCCTRGSDAHTQCTIVPIITYREQSTHN